MLFSLDDCCNIYYNFCQMLKGILYKLYRVVMIIYYEQVKEEGYTIETSYSFTEDNDKFDITAFNGRVDKAGDAYVVTGKLDMLFACPCDRCLEPVNMDISEDLVLTLSPLGEYPSMASDGEEGLSDEEAGMYVTPKDHFDIHELLREEALLLVPEKRLCKDDCKGICQGCGASLNTEKCTCVKENDSRWAALDKLK